jgi:hypothetical protein
VAPIRSRRRGRIDFNSSTVRGSVNSPVFRCVQPYAERGNHSGTNTKSSCSESQNRHSIRMGQWDRAFPMSKEAQNGN